MNSVSLMGRLTRDPDVRYTQSDNPMCIARYSLAVDRKFKRDGEATADFISCVCFGKTAEFVEKYLRKGMKMGVTGSIQTGSYEKDGHKVYTTEVVVQTHDFCESREESKKSESMYVSPKPGTSDSDGFKDINQYEEIELPFN